MNPRDFQLIAMELLRGNRAVDFRTAIGRSYYAAYNVAVEILKGMDFTISEGPQGHGEVRNRLHNSGDQDVEAMASELAELRGKRIDADYRLQRRAVENGKTAQTLVTQADKMIQIMDRCCSGPNREKIIKAIKAYEAKISPSPTP